MASTPYRRSLNHPLITLLLISALWKGLLLILAFLSPGPGYDTSTTLILDSDASAITRLAAKLTRWDAIYFVNTAERGHVYEQEWAFSWALSKVMASLAKLFPFSGLGVPHVWAGIAVANISHALSVLVLYALVALLLPEGGQKRTALVTALLHLFSPAGLFLSAPYGESLFSLLNFLGMLLYVKACNFGHDIPAFKTSVAHFVYMNCAGLCFAFATLIRSNGLLSGLIFAFDALAAVPLLLNRSTIARGLQLGFGAACAGAILATGFVVPQFLAHAEYCGGTEPRPWCTRIPPSIYTFVQEHYWNVGFLRYWTASNAPLFLLAIPTIYFLISSAVTTLSASDAAVVKSAEKDQRPPVTQHVLKRLALPQLALAVLTLLNFHVQIINRISSGYPLWYLAIAAGLTGDASLARLAVASPKASARVARVAITFAMVQGALYASFLPPA
ncbi:glycosyltransferase family 76 protein [Saccharata proteae CBS 121410]|uniref:GPI mannosyltransferase 2 n=1 Tax=Saccharata proteae CBS 121410 TaxID=1314787 RepID=A0A6A5YCQ8_9PEZI|nr:glycosyltransferase family 76 protein [Saccharata proteae CBS 121410]